MCQHRLRVERSVVEHSFGPSHLGEPDNDHEHGSRTGKRIKDRRPDFRRLFAWHDRVGRYVGGSDSVASNVLPDLREPPRDVVHVARIASPAKLGGQLGLLLSVLVTRSAERRVADDVAALLGLERYVPVDVQVVAQIGVRGGFRGRSPIGWYTIICA